MDEEKKQYLDNLKKQVDPEILAKMADYLGDGDDGSGPANVSHVQTPSDSAADLIRKRRAQEFQDRVTRRKRESQGDLLSPNKKDPEEKRTVFILSATGIWSRIVESQFKSLGFADTFLFEDFDALIRHTLDTIQNPGAGKFVIAVALKEIRHFILSWESVRKGLEDQKKESFLDCVVYFLVVESIKQVQDQLVQFIGENRIISITDELSLNKEKVNREFAVTES